MTTPEPRLFSESEHLAILADRVAAETASLTASVATLTSEKADLQNKLDVALAAHETLNAEKASVAKEFEDFKADLVAKETAAAKKDERLTKMREAAAHLKDEFFADADRIERVVAMTDESFEGYVRDLAAAAPTAPVDTTGTAPRETAMQGRPVVPPTEVATSAAASFFTAGLTK